MANPFEQQLEYPLGEVLPAPGTALEVAPGVRWVRMALPFALNHVNLWLLRDRQDGHDGGVNSAGQKYHIGPELSYPLHLFVYHPTIVAGHHVHNYCAGS